MDFPAVVSTAGLISSALSSIKSARELAKDVSDNGLKEQIGAAYETLLDLREHALTLDEENRKLKAQLAERAAYVGPVAPHGYFYAADDATTKYYPICPRCYQSSSALVAYMGEMDGELNRRLCNICNLAVYG